MQRRKKTPEAAKTESTQAPLQPAYFLADEPKAEPTTDSEPVQHESPVESARETSRTEVASVGDSSETSSGEAAPATPRRMPQNNAQRRRRRTRGGRGRRGGEAKSASAVSAQKTEPVAAPTMSAEPEKQEGASSQIPIAPAQARPSKGVVVLAIGLPGSGKSSWFKRHKITPLSSDLLRVLLFDDATEQRFQELIFSNLRSMLKARLIARRPTNYVDATNLTSHDRHGWIKLAKDYGYEVQAVFFDVPLEVCLERNQKRQRVVADDVMRRMASKLKAPTFEEGFTKITVVRVKAKETPEPAPVV